MKLQAILKFYCIVALLISLHHAKWCWTKSQVNNPSFSYDTSKGGFNWGYCFSGDNSKVKIVYSALVITSRAENSTTGSELQIKLCGSKGCFDSWATLSKYGFGKQGVKQRSDEFKGIDVGQIRKVLLRIGKGASSGSRYKCTSLTIFKDTIETTFDCLNPVESCRNCQIELNANGSYRFKVSVKTADGEQDGTKGPVHIILIGNKSFSSEKVLSDERLKRGSYYENIISSDDIGDEVIGFKLFLRGIGTWRPVSITIDSLINGSTKTFELNNVLLENPGKQSYEMRLSGNSEAVTERFSYGINALDHIYDDISTDDMIPTVSWESDFSFGLSLKTKVESHLDLNNPFGGYLQESDLTKIIALSCTQVLENTEKLLFGPDFPTKKAEYVRVIAKCPHNCHREAGTVFGLSIHPKKSPICLSAIVDKAMPPYGGLISISIFSGLDEYKVPKRFANQLGNIYIKSYNEGNSLKSYSIAKLDNIDMIDKDLRIVSWDGSLKSSGRLELRLRGEWGTVCNIGNNSFSASLICKEMGYKDGKWESSEDEESKSFCSRYLGQNHCGASFSKIHISNIECSDQDSTFKKCNKVVADSSKCDHSRDAIINCFNQNYQNEIFIPDKTVRLGGSFDYYADSQKYTGRLEIFFKGSFGSVCDHKFNHDTANVACKTMGYDKGNQETNEEVTIKYKLDRSSKKEFAASNLLCNDPRQTDMNNCQGDFGNIECTHELDVVISCYGEKGDPSGKKQYVPRTNNSPPELGKLGMASFEVKCDTLGTDPMFRGDPGSIYYLKCPAECFKSPALIIGSGVYSVGSNVCSSAIHSGVIEANNLASFIYIKTHGLENYPSFNSKGLESTSLSSWTPGFTVSKSNSSWSNLVKKWKSDEPIKASSSSFIELNSVAETHAKLFKYIRNKFRIDKNKYSSFIDLEAPSPFFAFVENDSSHNFSENDNYMFPGGNVSKMTEFSIYACANMADLRQEQDSTIFSIGGEDGFSLIIGVDSSLLLGNITVNQKFINLNINMPINTDFCIFVTYKNGLLSYSAKSSGMDGKSEKDMPTSLDTPSHGKIGVGRIPSNAESLPLKSKRPFYGKIYNVIIYNLALPFNMIKAIANYVKKSKKSAEKMTEYTVDSRECVSTCMETIPQTGTPPPEASLNFEVMKDSFNLGSNSCGSSQTAIFGGIAQSSINLNAGLNLQLGLGGSGSLQGELGIPSFNGFGGFGGFGGASSAGSGSSASTNASGSFSLPSFSLPSLSLPSFSGSSNLDLSGTGGLGSQSLNVNTSAGTSTDSIGSFFDFKGGNSSIYSKNPSFNLQASVGLSTKKLSDTASMDTIMIEKDTTLESDVFTNLNPGFFYRVKCPIITPGSALIIYGTAIYRMDSSICYSAMHFGRLSETGEILIKVGSSQEGYNGSVGNQGIQSLNGLGERKLSFTIEQASSLRTLSCQDTITSLLPNSAFGESFSAKCNMDCSDSQFNIYGGNTNPSKHLFSSISDDNATFCIYSDDSSICKAAQHCGVLNSFGGYVKFQILGQQNNFIKEDSFGITSLYKGSQLRSFSFTGQRIGIVANYKENYSNDINLNWFIESCNGNECVNKEENSWAYYENNNDYRNRLKTQKESVKSIKHTGSISIKRAMTASTIIKKRNVEFANGIINVNILMNYLDPIFIYYRYLDDMNHIGLMLSNSVSGSVVLFIKIQGSIQVIQSVSLNFNTSVWYRINAELHSEVINISITQDDDRAPTKKLEGVIKGLSRGTLAFGTNGNKDFMINGISIKPYTTAVSITTENPQESKITWNIMLGQVKVKNKIANYCKTTFKYSHSEKENCLNPHFYCRYRCQEKINEFQYGVLFLACIKDCKSVIDSMSTPIFGPTNPVAVTFDKGEKIDVKINDSAFPGIVISIETTQGEQYAKINYSENFENKTNIFNTGSGVMSKCGTLLTKRTDC